MATVRVRPDAGWVVGGKRYAALPKGPHGRNLCRFCSTEVPPRRYTFCSDNCVHEWKLRTRPAYVRKCLLKRDKGICRQCGFDAHALKLRLRKLRMTDPEAYFEAWEEMRARGVPGHRKTFWDADHVLGVAEGGGLCGLDGYQTLCIFCHQKKTVDGNRIRSRRRRETKSECPQPTASSNTATCSPEKSSTSASSHSVTVESDLNS